MKHILKRLANTLLETMRSGMVDIAYLHTMGMSPLEFDNHFGAIHPRYEEGHNMTGIVRLKNGD